MSNMTIEVVDLPDLDDSLPCELYKGYLGYLCGAPAAARVRLSCPECGDAGMKFMCRPCFDDLLRGNTRHGGCPFTPSTWTSA